MAVCVNFIVRCTQQHRVFMKRVDFLISVFICVICWREHVIGNEELPFYILLILLPMYALLAWIKQVQINLLKHDCNISGEEFSKKYKDISSI